jgi:hypothetical protein
MTMTRADDLIGSLKGSNLQREKPADAGPDVQIPDDLLRDGDFVILRCPECGRTKRVRTGGMELPRCPEDDHLMHVRGH